MTAVLKGHCSKSKKVPVHVDKVQLINLKNTGNKVFLNFSVSNLNPNYFAGSGSRTGLKTTHCFLQFLYNFCFRSFFSAFINLSKQIFCSKLFFVDMFSTLIISVMEPEPVGAGTFRSEPV